MPGNIRLYGTSGYLELSPPSSPGNVTLELPTDSIKPGMVKITDQTFSSASAVNVNNCFSSSYQSYRVIYRLTTSGSIALGLRLRSSGSDASGSNYFSTIFYSMPNTSTISAANQNAATFWYGWGLDATTNPGICQFIDLYDPFSSTATIMGGTYSKFSSVGSDSGTFSGFHNLNTSYDGFSLILGSGTSPLTGTIRVYGYRN